MNELIAKAEQLKESNVGVTMKADGDTLYGILSSTMADTRTDKMAIILSDEEGRGMVIPISDIIDINANVAKLPTA